MTTRTADSSQTYSTADTLFVPCGCSPLGKVKQVSQPYAPSGAQHWTVYNYDALGRTISVTAPDGASVTQYSYLGNTATVTDAAGHAKKFWMDVFGNLTKVQEPDGSIATYAYDTLDHLSDVWMTRGTVTQHRQFNYRDTSGKLTAFLQSWSESGEWNHELHVFK